MSWQPLAQLGLAVVILTRRSQSLACLNPAKGKKKMRHSGSPWRKGLGLVMLIPLFSISCILKIISPHLLGSALEAVDGRQARVVATLQSFRRRSPLWAASSKGDVISFQTDGPLPPGVPSQRDRVPRRMVTGQATSMNKWSGAEAPRMSGSIWISPLWLDSLISHKE